MSKCQILPRLYDSSSQSATLDGCILSPESSLTLDQFITRLLPHRVTYSLRNTDASNMFEDIGVSVWHLRLQNEINVILNLKKKNLFFCLHVFATRGCCNVSLHSFTNKSDPSMRINIRFPSALKTLTFHQPSCLLLFGTSTFAVQVFCLYTPFELTAIFHEDRALSALFVPLLLFQ